MWHTFSCLFQFAPAIAKYNKLARIFSQWCRIEILVTYSSCILPFCDAVFRFRLVSYVVLPSCAFPGSWPALPLAAVDTFSISGFQALLVLAAVALALLAAIYDVTRARLVVELYDYSIEVLRITLC